MIENNLTAMEQFYQNVNTDNKTKEDQNSREVDKTDEAPKSKTEDAFKLSDSLTKKLEELKEHDLREVEDKKMYESKDFEELDKKKLEDMKDMMDLSKIDYQRAVNLLT